MDWKLIAVLNVVLCVTAHPPRAAKSEQTFIKYFAKEEKVNAENDNSERQEEYVESYPSYEFSYKVEDPHTHDYKGQQEKRHGDKVNGNYWLIQPDGRKRLVKYHANDHIGFNVLIDYSQKANEEGGSTENKGSAESNSKSENEKRTWHVIHDYKMKKTSMEGGSQEGSNASAGQSNEKAESGQTEGRAEQNSQQSEAQENERSRSSQEGRKDKSRESSERNSNARSKESKWKHQTWNRQETRRGKSNEQQNSAQVANSKENSKSEKSEEKVYWYRIPVKYLKKGYEVKEDIKEEEESSVESERSNEAGGNNETVNEQSAEKVNEENMSNETNNVGEGSKTSGEQSARQESSENGSKEKVYGYKSYVYHIRH